ncbi:MAG TPA: DUF308 domain-containing protein [Pyrinomonadaceae bacterium]|nr:DUF308 domain-containing protein [Pyrinomonadaceae bacterium]
MREQLGNAADSAAKYSTVAAVLLIVFGCLAIALPAVVGLGASMLFGCTMLVAGFLHIGYAFTAKGAGGFLWGLLVSVVYMIGGIYLISNPGVALGGLTLAIAAVFVVEGVLQIIGFIAARGAPGAVWLLLSGIVAVALGVMIWRQFPSSALWAIGTMIGVNLISAGFNRLMAAAAFKRIAAVAHPS